MNKKDTASEEDVELPDNGCPNDGRLDELTRLLLSLELSEALTQLSGSQQQVLQLLFLQGLKPVEAAQKLDCSVRNIVKHSTRDWPSCEYCCKKIVKKQLKALYDFQSYRAFGLSCIAKGTVQDKRNSAVLSHSAESVLLLMF